MIAEPRRAIVTLTTDFGLSDPYVAAMKGALLSVNPLAYVVDVTHDVSPHNIRQAAFLTQCAWPFFPADTIHVAVIDPGVGTERRAIVLETPRGYHIGPDNGVLSAALPESARPQSDEATEQVPLPVGFRAVSITNRRYMLESISATFHGRDIFASAAAYLSCGIPLDDLGEQIDSIAALSPLRAPKDADGSLHGQVLHIDRFGNVITDIRAIDCSEGAFVIEIVGLIVRGPARTYAAAAGLAAIVGSTGYLEIALPNANTAAELGVDIGAAAVLRPTSS